MEGERRDWQSKRERERDRGGARKRQSGGGKKGGGASELSHVAGSVKVDHCMRDQHHYSVYRR